MAEIIKDGTGNGHSARVNKDNQLVTRAVSVEQRLKSSIDENYFEAFAGLVTLTDTVETGIIYIKNTNSNKSLVIDRVFWDIFTSTGGTGGDGLLKYYANPTITGGTDIVPQSSHYGAAQPADGAFKKSLTTFTGTEWWTAYITDKTSVEIGEGRIVLPDNSAHLITIQAPPSNTSMKVSVNIAFYYFDETLV